MADEQTQHPDTVDDAFRQAERQLEAKLEALRQTALGQAAGLNETGGSNAGWSTAVSDEVSWETEDDSSPSWEPASNGGEPAWDEPHIEPVAAREAETVEAEWDDAVMRPTGSSLGLPGFADVATEPLTPEPAAQVSSQDEGEEFEPDEDPYPVYDAGSPGVPVSAAPTRPRMYQPVSEQFGFGSEDDQLAALRTSLRLLQQGTDEIRHTLAPQVTGSVVDQVEGILRDELSAPAAGIRQIQAQMPAMEDRITRAVGEELAGPVAAINQLNEELPVEVQRIQRQLSSSVEDGLQPMQADVSFVRDRVGSIDDAIDNLRSALGDLDAAMGEELTRTGKQVESRVAQAQASLREDIDRTERAVTERVDGLAGDMQADFARFGAGMRDGMTRLEATLRDEIAIPAAAVRQLHDELPAQLQRLERVVRDTNAAPQVEQLLDTTAAQREQVLDAIDRAANRTLGAVTEQSESVTSEVGKLVDVVVREGERSAAALDRHAAAFEQVSQESVARQERMIREELGDTARNVRSIVELDLGGLFADLILAGRATLDKLSSVDGELGRDRVQRAEDLELTIDALTAGFSGMQEAFIRVLDTVGTIDQRIGAIEKSVATFDNLIEHFDATVEKIGGKLDADLGAMRAHLAELQPAPVVVTVAHPEANVQQSTRSGFLASGKDSGPGTSN